MATILIKYLPAPVERFVIGSQVTVGGKTGTWEETRWTGTWYTWEQATSHLRDQLHYRSDTINTALELACDLAGPEFTGIIEELREVKLVYPPVNPYESGE